MEFQDRLSLERVRRLSDGRIAAVARFARSGVYDYAGHEVGRPDLPTVKVYRPDDEVFSEDAMASFAHKAITLDHPSDPVTADNWKRVAVGYTEGRVARDRGFVEIPLMLADAGAVRAVQAGTAQELSAGYSCQLVWGDGVTPQGERYQAKQVAIRGNHIALVAQGRAGAECRIGDSAATLTDAERDTAIQRAKNVHMSHQRYSSNPLPFTDAQAANAIQQAKAEKARRATSTQAADDRAQAMRDQARDDYIARLTDSSKALRTARYS